MVLPELSPMHGVTQSPPHVYDVFDHTLLAGGGDGAGDACVFAQDQIFLGRRRVRRNAGGYLDETQPRSVTCGIVGARHAIPR